MTLTVLALLDWGGIRYSSMHTTSNSEQNDPELRNELVAVYVQYLKVVECIRCFTNGEPCIFKVIVSLVLLANLTSEL
jgi:hypothetical protein